MTRGLRYRGCDVMYAAPINVRFAFCLVLASKGHAGGTRSRTSRCATWQCLAMLVESFASAFCTLRRCMKIRRREHRHSDDDVVAQIEVLASKSMLITDWTLSFTIPRRSPTNISDEDSFVPLTTSGCFLEARSRQHFFDTVSQQSNRSIAFPHHTPLRHGVAVSRRSEICLSTERSKDAKR